MLLIGWMMKAIILGAKFDECRKCGVAGPHILLRKTHWFTVFRIPIVLLWVSHGILCPECGDFEPVGFLTMRRALATGRLPLGRARPGFETFVRDKLGGADPADWAAFGLALGASEADIHARWRELAKQHHPDTGGDASAFVRVQTVYRRLLAAPEVSVTSLPDPAEVFDSVIKNPNRGPIDLYTKAWPFLAAAVLIGGAGQQPSAGPTSRGTPYVAPVSTPALVGTPHTCWVDSTGINGCSNITHTGMLFGTTAGSVETCWFVEPLAPGQTAMCRP